MIENDTRMIMGSNDVYSSLMWTVVKTIVSSMSSPNWFLFAELLLSWNSPTCTMQGNDPLQKKQKTTAAFPLQAWAARNLISRFCHVVSVGWLKVPRQQAINGLDMSMVHSHKWTPPWYWRQAKLVQANPEFGVIPSPFGIPPWLPYHLHEMAQLWPGLADNQRTSRYVGIPWNQPLLAIVGIVIHGCKPLL